MNWAPLDSLKLTGFYLIGFSHATVPLTMSLIGANTRGTTKKMTMSACMFVAYCVGNMLGPHIFGRNERDVGFGRGFAVCLGCYFLSAAMAAGLRGYLKSVNGRRDREEWGLESEEETEREIDMDGDLTDFQTRGFRYRL